MQSLDFTISFNRALMLAREALAVQHNLEYVPLGKMGPLASIISAPSGSGMQTEQAARAYNLLARLHRQMNKQQLGMEELHVPNQIELHRPCIACVAREGAAKYHSQPPMRKNRKPVSIGVKLVAALALLIISASMLFWLLETLHANGVI